MLRPSITNGWLGRGVQKISDGARDPAMIQPSLTGLVHALFATQHCVLGYSQAVPAGLYATNSCRNSGVGKECTSYRTVWGCDPALIQPSGKAGTNVETPGAVFLRKTAHAGPAGIPGWEIRVS